MKKRELRRLFIAIDLPQELQDRICRLPGIFPEDPAFRWTQRGMLHLTLRFLGDTDEMEFISLKSTLEEVKFEPFRLVSSGVGFFPSPEDPRIYWLGLSHSQHLLMLKASLDQALAGHGIPRESRRFIPHITLARIRAPLSPGLAATLLEADSRLSGTGFVVDRFTLYSSQLHEEGAIHVPEAEYTA